MNVTRWGRRAALVALLGLPFVSRGGELVWRAAGTPKATPAPVTTTGAALGRPVVTMKRPVPLTPSPASGQAIVQTSYPVPRGPVARAQASDEFKGVFPPMPDTPTEPMPGVGAMLSNGQGPRPDPVPSPITATIKPIVVIPADMPDLPRHGTTVPVGGTSSGYQPPPSPVDEKGIANLGPSGGTGLAGFGGTAPPVDITAPANHLVSPLGTETAGGGATSPAYVSPDVSPSIMTDQPVQPGYFEKFSNSILKGGDRGCSGKGGFLKSDVGFPRLISPVTFPAFFEDPRSLTEVRPIFTYQGIPNEPATFGGGSAYYLGTQVRVAFTENLSLVINKLGMVSMDPTNTVPPVYSDTGFASFKLGPKVTFLRNEASHTVGAFGVNFDIPIGSERVFQGTGVLSLEPYFTIGQSFGSFANATAFNVMGTIGYSLSLDSQRSEFLFSHAHIDYNLYNRIFPLVEFNWFHYTSSGRAYDLGTEGGDLANIGSRTRRGSDLFTIAGGVRGVLTDHIHVGAAVEFPLSRERGLQDYRLTFDMIFRY